MKTGLIFLRALRFALVLPTLCLCGCSSTSAEKEQAPDDETHVSTMPWNKPQKWEGKKAIGGGGPGVGY